MEQDKQLEKLNKIIEYKVDLDILKTALTHRSFINEVKNRSLQHNERLEFLGDAVLELVVTEYLFENYKDLDEGVLTSFRAALVKTESLAEEAKRLGIGEFILMSKGEEQSGGRARQYILANTMEAIVGAIHLSLGYEKASEYITKNICYKLPSIIEDRKDIDAKSKLQEVAQEATKFTPRYELLTSVGPDHNKTFEMEVFIDKYNFGKGSGKSKQEAEQNAAQDAINNWDKLTKKYFKKN